MRYHSRDTVLFAAIAESEKRRRYRLEWLEEIMYPTRHLTLEQLGVALDRLMRGAKPFPNPNDADARWVPPARLY